MTNSSGGDESWKGPYGPYDIDTTVLLSFSVPKEADPSDVGIMVWELKNATNGLLYELSSSAIRGKNLDRAIPQSLIFKIPKGYSLRFKYSFGKVGDFRCWELK